MKNRKVIGLIFLLGLLYLSVCPAVAVTEVSALELSGSSGGTWTDLQDALINARRKGKTEITVRLDTSTFREFCDTEHIWYYAARAGVRNAGCTYWSDRRIRLANIEWWPWPMYLVHSREDFMEAVRLQKGRKDQTFGLLPDEELFREILGDDLMRDRLEYQSGLTGYETMYYHENECALWYPEPRIEETVYLEVSGLAACTEALRETVCVNPSARVVLAMDGLTYEMLTNNDSLNDYMLSAAGLCGGYQSNARAQVYLFPASEEVCYPGFLIAEAVRLKQEKELSMLNKLVLSRARELLQEVQGTDLEKATQIHDLLCNQITYSLDEITDEDYNCIGGILKGRANDAGYADTFYLCASLCGLKVRYIKGNYLEYDDGYSHLWNLIQLDGIWSSMDVAWDDQDKEDIEYEYFNIGLDRMRSVYQFSQELIPTPFTEITDLERRPVKEWVANNTDELFCSIDNSFLFSNSNFPHVLTCLITVSKGKEAGKVLNEKSKGLRIWYNSR